MARGLGPSDWRILSLRRDRVDRRRYRCCDRASTLVELTMRDNPNAQFITESILRALLPGTPCSVNGSGDLMMDGDAKRLIGKPCEVVKVTKSGLVQVALASDRKTIASIPRRNIDLDAGLVTGFVLGKACLAEALTTRIAELELQLRRAKDEITKHQDDASRIRFPDTTGL